MTFSGLMARPAPLATAAVVPHPCDGQQITLRMRMVHRLTSLVNAKPVVLRNVEPLVSFTFDDVPDSAATLGAQILEEAGVRGTFFVATSLFGHAHPHWRCADERTVAGLAARGHEIGLHSHQHRPSAHMSRRAFATDLNQSDAILAAITDGAPVVNFAYPFGFGAFAHRRALGQRVRSCRTTHPGLNAGAVDATFLKSHTFGNTLHEAGAVDGLIASTASRGAWLIFTGHDVADSPSPYGCTPALLAHAVKAALTNKVTILPVADALRRCGVE